MPTSSPMRIRLSGDRRDRVLRSLQRFFAERLDRPLSPFQAEQVLDLLVVELGAPIYNQAIRDAHAFIQDKLVDLEGEFYEPEERADD
ncbi:MAG: DUF2164 domain-containing protein [Myxococcota bacterium]